MDPDPAAARRESNHQISGEFFHVLLHIHTNNISLFLYFLIHPSKQKKKSGLSRAGIAQTVVSAWSHTVSGGPIGPSFESHQCLFASTNKAAHSGTETQWRCHQKSKTGVSVAPQKVLQK